MQANDSPNLLCTSSILSDVPQRNLLGKAEDCFDAAVNWVLLPLEGEHSAGRGPLVWVDRGHRFFVARHSFSNNFFH